VDWRRLQAEPELADNKADAAVQKNSKHCLGEQIPAMPKGIRKPSERFMRRPLQARSRVSKSERFRIEGLKEKLNTLVVETTNEQTVFNGYRPGHEAKPG
jgi:hypothetical protein